MGRKLLTSADDITTTATKIELHMFTQEEFHTCFVLCAHCGNDHGSPSIYLIQMYSTYQYSMQQVLLETGVGNQKNISN